jgi:hypothetical protein
MEAAIKIAGPRTRDRMTFTVSPGQVTAFIGRDHLVRPAHSRGPGAIRDQHEYHPAHVGGVER